MDAATLQERIAMNETILKELREFDDVDARRGCTCL